MFEKIVTIFRFLVFLLFFFSNQFSHNFQTKAEPTFAHGLKKFFVT